jgi:hypothetical protein
MPRRRKGYSSVNSITGASDHRGSRGGRGGGGSGGGGGGYSSANATLGSSGQSAASRAPSIGRAGRSYSVNRSNGYSISPITSGSRRGAPVGTDPTGRGRGAVLARVKQGPAGASLLERLDREFGEDEEISERDAALLAEAFGLPGKTYGQIAIGESTLRPGAKSSDGGLGLWQMTPRVQSPETQAAWNKIASEHKGGYLNPVANARMAAYLAQGGTGVSNYYGDQYVTNENAHVRGGPQRAKQLLGMRGKPGSGRKPLSVNELFYDPGINIADGQPTSAIGGHGTHVHYASTRPKDILRAARIAQKKGLNVSENPAFDEVEPVHTSGSHHYQEMPIPRRLRPLARKVGATGNVIGEAIDVNTGSAEQLSAFNRAIARRGGAPIGASSGVTGSYASGGAAGLSGGGYPGGVSATGDQRVTTRSGRSGSRTFSPAAALQSRPDLTNTAGQSATSLLDSIKAMAEEKRRRSTSRRRLAVR